ncbi:hypothetical protein MNBD_IGNAVI01-1958 [hydrothermal vent metagenome]|uniref:Uncharacterized protein n=1 Tax=hydrothermal vent metagenome TaxID=652676 RepID=A0A3B1CI14_9ZZZZ
MGGKAAILLVLGFSVIFLVYGHRFNRLSTDSVDNLSNYYVETKAHNIAVSAANLAANELFRDKTWETGFDNVSFDGGTYNVYVSNNVTSSGKVIICHIPPGNSAAQKTMTLPASAISGHQHHGDILGPCPGDVMDEQKATIVAEGTYQGITKVVTVDLRPSYFSKFGNYYAKITAMPATGDTFNGPFHTNGKLTTWGTPVFWGKTTAKRGLRKKGYPKDPKFYGGFESGVDIPLEFDTTGMRKAASLGGKVFRDTTNSNQKTKVKLEFLSNGDVEYKQKIGSGPWSPEVTVPLISLAPDGVIFVERGNVYVKGTLNGRLTVVASKKGKSGCGNIYQTDDLKYNSDPRANPNSTDVLGLVAENNIRIQYNNDTRHDNVITQASMFALKGNIGPDNALVKNDHKLASWKILGGLIAKTTRVTAHYNSAGPYEGYRFVHSYDDRFMTYVPPYFPHTRNLEIVSWYE